MKGTPRNTWNDMDLMERHHGFVEEMGQFGHDVKEPSATGRKGRMEMTMLVRMRHSRIKQQDGSIADINKKPNKLGLAVLAIKCRDDL